MTILSNRKSDDTHDGPDPSLARLRADLGDVMPEGVRVLFVSSAVGLTVLRPVADAQAGADG